MRNEAMRYGRRVMGIVIGTALCVVVAYAADPPKKNTPAAQAAPVKKSTTTAAKSTKPKPAAAPVACKPQTSYVEPVCVAPSAQKFNTIEDIYAAPATAAIVPAASEQDPATPPEKRR